MMLYIHKSFTTTQNFSHHILKDFTHCCKIISKEIIIITIYIDDALFMGSNRTKVLNHKKKFMKIWESVKTGFTPEVTPRKSGVEGGWDLASPYVVHPCLHTQWSRISGLVGGGDKDLSRGVNKPVRVGPSRLLE